MHELIGVDARYKNQTFHQCDDSVAPRFAANLDRIFPTEYYIAALLERGVRVLVYVGANDWVCNWVCYHCPVSMCP